jgi:prepilin-type processing-associated H-X9-DG protein
MKQIGLALHNHHMTHGAFPAGLVCSGSNTTDAEATGFTYLLPFLEQDTTHRLYHFDDPWFAQTNYDAVGRDIRVFFCPSNRPSGRINLAPMAQQWGAALPPYAGSTDYAFNKGANGSLYPDGRKVPYEVRGAFDVLPPENGHTGVRLTEIGDGTTHTFALGEAAGGMPGLIVRSLADPEQPVIDPFTGQPAIIEQSWSAAGVGDTSHPWYGSVFGVTAQFGFAPDPRDEPMNRRLLTPTVFGGGTTDNANARDYVSGFRSRHSGGCNFLFCDGGVRFVRRTIRPEVYRAMSTANGGETVNDE